MTENYEEGPGNPPEIAPDRKPDDVRPRHAEVGTGKFGQKTRAGGFILAAGMLGWTVVRGIFFRHEVPEKNAPEAKPARQRAAPRWRKAAATASRAPKKTGRSADRNLDIASRPKLLAREMWGTLWVACALGLGVAAGVGFLFIYWTGGSNLLLGGTLALFLGCFGVALVLYSHWLVHHTEATEPREELPSSAEEREAALKAYCGGAQDMHRRALLKWIGAAAAGLLAAMIVSLMRSLGMSPYPTVFSTVWKRGQRLMTVDGKPIALDSLQPGSSMTVFPENSLGSEKAQTVLIRVDPHLLQLPEGRGNWAPMGYLAYSRVCTHAGCPVAMFEPEAHLLLCPCHQSTFNVLNGATPTGGPAARPLPQLPLYADSDGNLRAGGGFSSSPGPGFWGKT